MDSATLQALRRFPDELETHFGAVPESYRGWRPDSWAGCPSESFPAIGQICHIRDIETDGYHLRFQRIRAESSPTLESIDGYALEQSRAYATADPSEVFAAIRRARARTLELLESVRADEWARTARFDRHGIVTMRGMVHLLCSHDHSHVSGLQWLLTQISLHETLRGHAPA